MEEAAHELLSSITIVLYRLAQRSVVELTKLLDDAVNHGWREYIILLEHLTLTLKHIGRSHT